MDNKKIDYFKYWGKVSQSADGIINYHLLPYHCLDVAAVGYLLLDDRRSLTQRLANQLDVSFVWFKNVFCFFLSLHDIGKFATAFQGQVDIPGKLVAADSRMPYTVRHDTLGFFLWEGVLGDKWREEKNLFCQSGNYKSDKLLRSFRPWIEIVMGHHGIPPRNEERVRCQDFFTENDEEAAWQFCCLMKSLFIEGMDLSIMCDKSFKKKIKLISWQLAGFVVIADWLGSSLDPKDYITEEMSLELYWQEYALPRGRKILNRVNIDHAQPATFSGIKNLFSHIKKASSLQQWAETVPLVNKGQLFVLEDVTGSGKTEAALILASRLMSQGVAEGLYIALPTMATANAMYDRLKEFYKKLYTDDRLPSLVLSHGSRHLSQKFKETVGLIATDTTEERNYGKNEWSASAYCNAWLADSRKKALLAEVGVGTLDQVLMGVLPARHQSLRLLGLARKVLIVDEVHAYDPYMNELLEALLEVHARQGGSAILLSATLPQEMRRKYVNAFCLGINESPPLLDSDAGYPLATQFPYVKSCEHVFYNPSNSRHDWSVVFFTDPCQAIAQIEKAVNNGQCICWIRNTVEDARKIYHQIKREPWIKKEHLTLFHSRFAMIDRQRIEERVIYHFGPKSTEQDRKGRVLIATQVVEQSLDLDFDILISDIAPIDLLVQRAGRLQRHVRDRNGNPLDKTAARDLRAKPIFYVVSPDLTDCPEKNWLKSNFPGTQAVYRHTGRIWLTQQCLMTTRSIRMPEDSRRLIESVYSEEAQSNIPEALQDQSVNAEGDEFSKRSIARLNKLDISKGYTWASAENSGGWADETHIPTRLSDKTITVVLVRIVAGRLEPYANTHQFAWEQSMINLPQKDWQNIRQKISSQWIDEIEKMKKEIRVLKWVEVLPLTKEIENVYDPNNGWGIETGGVA